MELPSNLEKEGKDRHWWEDIGTEERRQKNTEGNDRGWALKKKKKSFKWYPRGRKYRKAVSQGKKLEGSPRYQKKNTGLKEQMNGYIIFVAMLKYFELFFSSLEGLHPCL